MKEALEGHEGVTCYVCSVGNGGDIQSDIYKNYDESDVSLIHGTETYGRDTMKSVGISTCHEMNLIVQDKRDVGKPFFLMKMCDRYLESCTRATFHDAIAYEDCRGWKEGVPPANLVKKILDAGARAKGIPIPLANISWPSSWPHYPIIQHSLSWPICLRTKCRRQVSR